MVLCHRFVQGATRGGGASIRGHMPICQEKT
eukprot:CAMPEP_0203962598 /NCGR_PEP_ID=MMETSP0359-20131031/92746_1 /ASSEMBLY_ACC=CAM_ASM_000338 /TAXON_ID=268821 /ORGANISM="Scrippsiella Hangoei, Strain SHTV-5" /LENGTH=30 /DNA_ID= /DNA_START= /DNA_END= /DNA_ORIENTATION=